MGLDTVELVLACEEEFNLVISDGDAEKMQTPRHVIDYVEKVTTRTAGRSHFKFNGQAMDKRNDSRFGKTNNHRTTGPPRKRLSGRRRFHSGFWSGLK